MYKQDRSKGEARQERRESGSVDDVIRKIQNLENLSKLTEKEIAEERGLAEQVAKEIKDLKTTQLRKLFDKIKVNERELMNKGWSAVEPDFYMIRPNLAYAKARKLIPDSFFRLMDVCMKQVDKGDEQQKKANYGRFVRFLEAIVAYHKYYWGDKK